ncbi:MAG: DNA-binding response regulator [Bacteroidetes bacterium]|nr:MAG: DNA-binding response regulator [Bacteroidota bacterium]
MDYLIVEDEYHAAKRLRSLIEKNSIGAHCLAVIDSVEDAVIWFNDNTPPDLAFFDIQLADGLSFKIFQEVRVDVPVIFTTAFDEYALKAFKTNSVDYLLKPIDEKELVSAIDKYKRHFGNGYASPESSVIAMLMQKLNTPEYMKRFLIKQGSALTYIPVEDIAYFCSRDGLTFLVTQSNHKHNIDYTMEQVEELIDPALFFRINRKVIASVQAVSQISSYFNSRLKLTLVPGYTEDAIVSREKVKKFKHWMRG